MMAPDSMVSPATLAEIIRTETRQTPLWMPKKVATASGNENL